jgi:hypothetical protein
MHAFKLHGAEAGAGHDFVCQKTLELGAIRDIKNDYVGAKAQFGFNIGQLEFELITAYSDNHELKGGLYGKVEL